MRYNLIGFFARTVFFDEALAYLAIVKHIKHILLESLLGNLQAFLSGLIQCRLHKFI